MATAIIVLIAIALFITIAILIHKRGKVVLCLLYSLGIIGLILGGK